MWGALSFEFALFILLAAAFTFLLHKTNFGRRTYAIGNNPTGAWFSGIDLSVASTMALSSTVMGFCAAAGMDTPLLVVIGLGVGLLCGLFNGLLVTRFNLSSIVIDHSR